jgi:hypothetical protein
MDLNWNSPQLKDLPLLQQIASGNLLGGKPELAKRVQHSPDMLHVRANQNVEIASETRSTVVRDSVSAYD